MKWMHHQYANNAWILLLMMHGALLNKQKCPYKYCKNNMKLKWINGKMVWICRSNSHKCNHCKIKHVTFGSDYFENNVTSTKLHQFMLYLWSRYDQNNIKKSSRNSDICVNLGKKYTNYIK